MAVQTRPIVDLTQDAYEGSYKLPAFQRGWKWKRRQVEDLFDSLRRDYPIGGFLLAPARLDIELEPRSFQFSGEGAETAPTDHLVMDGQQRLTACIQLFFDVATGRHAGTHYFLDLSVIQKEFEIFASGKGVAMNALLEQEDAVKAFVEDLEAEKHYIRGVNRVRDPWARLVSHQQLFTPLLLQKNVRQREVELEKYYAAHPDKKVFIRNIILSHFVLGKGPEVPCIIIERQDVEALSRIFSTLNTTGKLLTPFELVVATLYPKHIDLRREIEDGREIYPQYYPNMDPTGEIALQTCVLLDNEDPKKSRLPKTLTAQRWQKNSGRAFFALDAVGRWLTERLGFALNLTDKYIPYDSVFAPLAYVFANVDFNGMNAAGKGRAYSRLERYVIGSSLSQRYQEGVHNKQATDAKQLKEWVIAADDTHMPAWLSTVTVPSMMIADPNGAIGKTILCLINRKRPKDPVTREDVSLGDSRGQDHHIFPTRYVGKLAGWLPARDSADRILNIMRLEKKTNAEFLNDDPMKQLERAESAESGGRGARTVAASYDAQWVDESCREILKRPAKTRQDFEDFLKARQATVRTRISEEFDFPSDPNGQELPNGD